MALYLGSSKKLKINLDGVIYRLNLEPVSTTGIRLVSSDNYILRDSSGLYLIPKIELPFNVAFSYDDYALKDLDGLYITLKEI